ncbi:MAG: hypothetical protein ACR2ID_01035 [Chthoniobacterales bacterium]
MISHRHRVRLAFVLALLVGTAIVARGQDQERKLLDRVLKPDMSLQNEMQTKRFDPRGRTETKQAPTKSFSVVDRRQEKQFGGSRNYDAKAFATRQSRDENSQANLSTRTRIVKADSPYPAPGYAGVKASWDGDKAVATRGFSHGDRPFLVRGKSQTALSQQNRQLTIDEVRELLNKNK